MGRPKLSDLSCTICNMKFKRKNLLEEHMENHLCSSKPTRKHLKSYCYVCRKSFEPDQYKLHMQSEHQFDIPKVNSNTKDDLYSCENGFVLLSKKKIKKDDHISNEKLSAIEKGKSLIVSVTDIKIEPPEKVKEEYDSDEHQKAEDKISIKKNTLQFKIPKLKCSICGMQCKGKKGLNIHMNAHRKARRSSRDDGAFQSENENYDSSPCQSPNGINQFSMSNYAQNAQPNYILPDASPFQNQPNLMIRTNQSLPSDKILKFDSDSEKYVKWLKKFVDRCKMHNYPLNPELCKKISIVTGEITTALGNPKSSLKQRANHFYFMSAYNILAEIMLNHLQYTLIGVSK